MGVHVRLYLAADRETISVLVTRFSEFDLPDWLSADEIDRTNRLSLQQALEEPEPDPFRMGQGRSGFKVDRALVLE